MNIVRDRTGKSKMLDDPHPCALENRLAKSWPAREWSESHVVLAVSGGPDSVALLRAMAALKVAIGGNGKLYVAHLNHGLRGIAANDDETWLKILCERLGIPAEIGSADVAAIAGEQGDGFEAAARTARYDFLRQTAERLGRASLPPATRPMTRSKRFYIASSGAQVSTV